MSISDNSCEHYLHKNHWKFTNNNNSSPNCVYLYYNKAISKILLSKAEDYHIRKLKSKSFLKLKYNWINKKTFRRQILRANVHYKYALQRNAFLKWNLAVTNKKRKLLTIKIINLHFSFKIKCKYWAKLKYAKQIQALNKNIVENKRKIVINLFLHINVMELAFLYYNLLAEFKILTIGYANLKKRKLTSYFKNWRAYRDRSLVKRNHQRLCKLFLKSKYNPEHLRLYFEKWQNYTQMSIIKELKLKIADQQMKNKLLYRYLSRLKLYKDTKQTKIKNISLAVEFYNRSILIRYFRTWVTFTNEEIRLKNLWEDAQNFHIEKLKFKYLEKLRIFAHKQKMFVEHLLLIERKTKHKVLQRHFVKLKKFLELRKIKLRKRKSAEVFCKRLLVQTYFNLLQKYVKKRKNKFLQREETIYKSLRQRNRKLSCKCFDHWKIYVANCRDKKLKLLLADLNHKNFLLKNTTLKWIAYVEHKKLALNNLNILKVKFEHTNKMNYFSKWQSFVQNSQLFKEQILRAKDLHKRAVINDGLRAIITIAYKKEQQQQKLIMKNLQQKYLVTLKYYKIWKYKALAGKTLFSKVRGILTSEYNFDDSGSFRWDPNCFERPRVPDCLKLFNYSNYFLASTSFPSNTYR